jgi:hypothetical protein
MNASQRWPFRVAMTLLGRCVAVRGPQARTYPDHDPGHRPDSGRPERPNGAVQFAAHGLAGFRAQAGVVDAAERFHP